ncbi:tRNA-dihydrouridine(20a/20b) synthase [NAD(P)+]-like protein [Geranomyces michiganensis]|nr:tRNA-dihydrouridine(20a/20b) synthase [NAD(P)+]-like protein [Geranomyces michiganensis]
MSSLTQSPDQTPALSHTHHLHGLHYSRSDVDGDSVPVSPHTDEEESYRDPTHIPPRKSAVTLMREVKERKGNNGYMAICAPMVRYSKLPFRELVRTYGVDLAYTPMILADVYKHSTYSRDIEFRTNAADSPVVVQFAASNGVDLADAAELAAPYSSGVDLNCGCPQKWAISERIGSHLMGDPERVRDMVRQVKARVGGLRMADGEPYPVSIKIRVHADPRRTVEFVKRAESVGVDWITVHGRTSKQRSTEPVNLDAIKLVKENASVPVFANGDVFSLEDADRIVAHTRTDGVMAARGLLENPALFAGYKHTPMSAVQDFVRLSTAYGSVHFIFHHHLMYMLESSMSRAEKKSFNILSSGPAIIDYLQGHYGLDFTKYK